MWYCRTDIEGLIASLSDQGFHLNEAGGVLKVGYLICACQSDLHPHAFPIIACTNNHAVNIWCSWGDTGQP